MSRNNKLKCGDSFHFISNQRMTMTRYQSLKLPNFRQEIRRLPEIAEHPMGFERVIFHFCVQCLGNQTGKYNNVNPLTPEVH